MNIHDTINEHNEVASVSIILSIKPNWNCKEMRLYGFIKNAVKKGNSLVV
jgi:hypothetical protein